MSRSRSAFTRFVIVAVSVPALVLLPGCGGESEPAEESAALGAAAPAAGTAVDPNTCRSIYPSYWQDPNPKFAEQWVGQQVSNVPPEGYTGPVFRLSDGYPTSLPDERADQPWRDARFDAMFDPSTDQATKTQLANDYIWAVMRYSQEGNLENDWDVCENTQRNWYHMPFQTYDVLSGREFTHGLTREAPVKFSVNTTSDLLDTTMWAVGYFNPTAAYTLGQIWEADGTPEFPTENIDFAEGAVVAKPLFNTSSPAQLPVLSNMPAWKANISEPSFCACKPAAGESSCSMVEQSQQCPRSLDAYGPVSLLQFDIAVKDSRAPGTAWVFGTFVADGVRKAGEPEPWNRIAPLGLMWGVEPPPAGQLAYDHPADPRTNGFEDMVIFWDTVDMLNEYGGGQKELWPGHLGCNQRLDGPADNQNSACMSCHMTASVVDENLNTPPIVAQFYFEGGKPGLTAQCVEPDAGNPNQGVDAGGAKRSTVNGVSFADIDSLYFFNTAAATPFNTTVGGTDVLPTMPVYASGRKEWISLDYSLQLSISLLQWSQWDQHAPQPDDDAAPESVQLTELTPAADRDHVKLPRRNVDLDARR
ncbi:MAG: hypothetical protein DWQ36_13480 [Acidobacteria bacterium]|nr:MAG: hypothetical protein DWQ36_13480 [Acidobacteriota bacterium]